MDLYYWNIKGLNLNLKRCSMADIRNLLADFAGRYKRSTLRQRTQIVKMILTDFGREKDAKALHLPKRGEARVVVYSQGDVAEMQNACRMLRDRLLIEILMETGARRGELYNMQIKDLQFDQYSAIVWLRGKTGTRTRRIYDAIPDILRYLQEHPRREDPEAKFWVRVVGGSGRWYHSTGRRARIRLTGQGLSKDTIWRIVHNAGLRGPNRRTYPHGFRHTAATSDVKIFTDREMMIRYGWSSPEMVGIYAHLNPRDVDDKDLAIHGLKTNGGNRPCPKCNQYNPFEATYCMKCGQILALANRDEQHEIPVRKDLSNRLNKTAKEEGITVDRLLHRIIPAAESNDPTPHNRGMKP